MPIRFRDASARDLPRLWEIDQLCFEPTISYSLTEMAYYLARPNAFGIVAEVEAQGIIGFAIADKLRSTGHIVTIDVLEQMRGRGLGTELMSRVEERLRALKCSAVVLETAV